MDLDFELDKLFDLLSKKNYKKILIQLPDGLKPYANIIYDKIREKYPNIEIYIYFGSDFGGCDIPIWMDKYGFDLLVHFGHLKYYKPVIDKNE